MMAATTTTTTTQDDHLSSSPISPLSPITIDLSLFDHFPAFPSSRNGARLRAPPNLPHINTRIPEHSAAIPAIVLTSAAESPQQQRQRQHEFSTSPVIPAASSTWSLPLLRSSSPSSSSSSCEPSLLLDAPASVRAKMSSLYAEQWKLLRTSTSRTSSSAPSALEHEQRSQRSQRSRTPGASLWKRVRRPRTSDHGDDDIIPRTPKTAPLLGIGSRSRGDIDLSLHVWDHDRQAYVKLTEVEGQSKISKEMMMHGKPTTSYPPAPSSRPLISISRPRFLKRSARSLSLSQSERHAQSPTLQLDLGLTDETWDPFTSSTSTNSIQQQSQAAPPPTPPLTSSKEKESPSSFWARYTSGSPSQLPPSPLSMSATSLVASPLPSPILPQQHQILPPPTIHVNDIPIDLDRYLDNELNNINNPDNNNDDNDNDNIGSIKQARRASSSSSTSSDPDVPSYWLAFAKANPAAIFHNDEAGAAGSSPPRTTYNPHLSPSNAATAAAAAAYTASVRARYGMSTTTTTITAVTANTPTPTAQTTTTITKLSPDKALPPPPPPPVPVSISITGLSGVKAEVVRNRWESVARRRLLGEGAVVVV